MPGGGATLLSLFYYASINNTNNTNILSAAHAQGLTGGSSNKLGGACAFSVAYSANKVSSANSHHITNVKMSKVDGGSAAILIVAIGSVSNLAVSIAGSAFQDASSGGTTESISSSMATQVHCASRCHWDHQK